MTVDYEIYKEGGILKDRYQKIEDISEGSYGYVSLAKDLKEKKLVAVKYIFKLDEDEDRSDNDCSERNYDSSQEKFHIQNKTAKNNSKSSISSNVKSRMSDDVCFEAMYEVDIQTKIGKHKNIVQLLDFFDSYIILEYCTGGDLYEAIKDDIIPRSTNSITHIISQIIDAVEFVHNKHIYHRDIKPENILITGIDWTIKLTDWGLATTNDTSMDRSIGSERYMAPELFESNLDLEERKEPYRCDKVDLWAMGIVFLNIVFHKNPFSVANQSDKSFCYFAANREALFDVFSSMTYDFFQVLRYCLTIDPMNRDLKQIRVELDNLNEYTFDDEYYNNLEEEENYGYGSSGTEYDTEVSESTTNAIQPPVSLPTPVNSSKPSNEPMDKLIDVEMDKSAPSMDNNNTATNVTTDSTTDTKEGVKDTDNQSSHQNNEANKQLDIPTFNIVQDKLYTHYKSPNNNNNKVSTKNDNFDRSQSNFKNKHNNNKKNRGKKKHNGRYHIKPMQIENRNKPKIIKNSRKPLGIPTPNTHINNFFHDYKKSKDKSNFNTRDFFTPPSVQNRYMEGVFDHKYRKNRSKHYLTTNTNNNNNYNPHGNHSPNKGWSSSYNQNNGFSNNFKFNKFRRPSTTGNSGYNVTSLKGSHGQRNSFNNISMTSGFFRRGSLTTHSPGAYIPPNQRSSMSLGSGNPIPNLAYASISTYNNIPDISTVLDDGNYNNSPGSVNSHTSRDSGNINRVNYNNNIISHGNNTTGNLRKSTSHELNILNDDGHESDDALFTLEENDSDLVKNFNSLSINSGATHTGMMNHNHINNNSTAVNIAGHDLLNVPSANSVSSNTLGRSFITNNNLTITNDYLPDLLKSPVSNGSFRDEMIDPLVSSNYYQSASGNTYHGSSFDGNHLRTFKPGVYIPPHHRRASMNEHMSSSPPYEHVLNVSNNQISYSGGNKQTNNRRQSVIDTHDNNQSFNILVNPSHSTTSLQNDYVFADSNNEAITFKEEGDFDTTLQHQENKELDPNNGRTVFGPYEIYDNESDYDKLNKFTAGRKPSTLQEEIVGSLEQYKNNWLLQQQSQQE